jgi:hypothetical protein
VEDNGRLILEKAQLNTRAEGRYPQGLWFSLVRFSSVWLQYILRYCQTCHRQLIGCAGCPWWQHCIASSHIYPHLCKPFSAHVDNIVCNSLHCATHPLHSLQLHHDSERDGLPRAMPILLSGCYAGLAAQLEESHKAVAEAEGRAAAAEDQLVHLKQQVENSEAQVCNCLLSCAQHTVAICLNVSTYHLQSVSHADTEQALCLSTPVGCCLPWCPPCMCLHSAPALAYLCTVACTKLPSCATFAATPATGSPSAGAH